MRCWIVTLVLLQASGAARAQEGDSWGPAKAAIREVAQQLQLMQRAFATIPGPPEGRGLYKQADQIQTSLIYLQRKIANQDSRDSIVVAFLALDGQVKQLLEDLQGFAQWEMAIRFASRELKSAESDLHFAILSPDGNADRQGQALYRQTLAMIARAEDLHANVRYVYLEQDPLPAWMDAMKELRNGITEFQRLQNAKAFKADLKAQLVQVNKSWDNLVSKFKAIPQFTYYLMQTDAVRFDSLLSRVDQLMGLGKRPARLPAGL